MKKKDLGKTSLGMEPNVSGLLSYILGLVSGIIFYVLEKENKFVRFHAMQSIIVSAVFFVLSMALGFIPIIGWVLALPVSIVGLLLWVLLMVKAYQGEYFKLPVVGEIAEKNS